MTNFKEIELTSEGHDAIKEDYAAIFEEMQTGHNGITENYEVDIVPGADMGQIAIVRALQDIAAELRGLRADIQCLGADSDEE